MNFFKALAIHTAAVAIVSLPIIITFAAVLIAVINNQ